MAGVASVTMGLQITGLGTSVPSMSLSFEATVPDAVHYDYRKLAAADTDEVLSLGDVSTVQGVIIKAVDYVLDVDCDYVAAFDADIVIPVGQTAYFKPSGIVRVKNNGAGEQPIYEFIVHGTR